MKKFLLLLSIVLLTSTSVKAEDSFNTYVNNLSTCTPYKYTRFFMTQIDEEIVGWKNGACELRNTVYTYDLPKGADFFSLTDEELESYMIPGSASVYRLTKRQLKNYQKSLVNGMKDSQNKTSITISTSKKNTTRIKAVKNYEYRKGQWIEIDNESYLIF